MENIFQRFRLFGRKSSQGQSWFDNEYSNQKELIIGGGKTELEGTLKIEGFKNLESISLKKLKLECLEITNCPRLIKIELSDLGKLTSVSVNDCKGPIKFICSCEKLTELEVSNLIELDCSNTSIEKLSLNLCPDIETLNCSNKKLKLLDVSNCSKLEKLDCLKTKLTTLDLSNCESLLKKKDTKDVRLPPELNVYTEKRKTKNLIIIGRTGGGKSTLSNVLTNTDEFVESGRSTSVTKGFQKKEFEWYGKYLVVDTIGVGDTKLTTKRVLYQILNGIFSTPEGISQILFVIDGRFTAEEVNSLKLISGSIPTGGTKANKGTLQNIFDYVTIVRTKFSNFKNKEECDKDKEELYNENEIVGPLAKSCRDIVYVNNPPTNIQVEDDDDKDTIENNKKIRQKSREILLNYLNEAIDKYEEEYFKLAAWDKVQEQVLKYIDEHSNELPADLENNQELKALVEMGKFCSIS